MQVACPDGTVVSVGSCCVFGRQHLGAAADDGISRQQFQLDTVEGVEGVVQLNVLGRNALIVERALPGRTADDDQWELTDYLEQGMTTVMPVGARCYVAARKATTIFKLQPAAANLHIPGGSKRAHPDSAVTSAVGRGRSAFMAAASTASASAVAAAAASSSVTEQIDDLACFQLLRVRGIPDWANRGAGGCSLRDVVCGSMKWVLASDFMVDMTWMLSACPALLQAHQLIIVHGERIPERVGDIRAVASSAGLNNTVVHAPPLPVQFGTYHSKAFVIEYEKGLRVIVHTANLIYVDCNNKSQGLWHQDFPLKAEGSPATSEFEQELSDYLKALRLPQATANKAQELCRQHDFSSARVHLIISCPGYHSGSALKKYGHLRVQTLLARENFPAHFQGAPLIAQFSSLGSLDDKWLTQEFKGSLSAGKSSAGGKLGGGAAGPEGLQLIWPTVQDIRNSVEGWRGGASVPGPAKNVNKPFLQPYWHKWGGQPWGRQRAMPHIKSYTRYRGQQVAWFILASHNLSKAAWGALQKQGTQLFIRSFELGVLFVPSLEAAYRQHPHRGFTCNHPPEPPTNATTQPSADVGASVSGSEQPVPKQEAVKGIIEFWTSQAGAEDEEAGASSTSDAIRLTMPLPYMLPPAPYTSSDHPWCVDIDYDGKDSLGRDINDPVQSFYGHVQPPD